MKVSAHDEDQLFWVLPGAFPANLKGYEIWLCLDNSQAHCVEQSLSTQDVLSVQKAQMQILLVKTKAKWTRGLPFLGLNSAFLTMQSIDYFKQASTWIRH